MIHPPSNHPLILSSPLFPSNSHKGNKILIGIVSINIFIYFLTKLYFIYRNKSRAAIWDAMTLEEKNAYLDANPEPSNRR
jgi:hypothetical protein